MFHLGAGKKQQTAGFPDGHLDDSGLLMQTHIRLCSRGKGVTKALFKNQGVTLKVDRHESVVRGIKIDAISD